MPRSFNKVFCLGLSRTGTTSLCAGLESFGLKTIHYPIHLFTQSEVLGLPSFSPALKRGPYASWRRGKELKASRVGHDARRILESHDAFGDLPVPLYLRELDRLYPGSIFIHTTRSIEPWIKSMEWLFDEGGVLWKRGQIGDELHRRVYGTTRFDEAALREAFLRHESNVHEFFMRKGNCSLVLKVDAGEMTYEALAAVLGIATGKSGLVPKMNEAQNVGISDRVSLQWAKATLLPRLALRTIRGTRLR